MDRYTIAQLTQMSDVDLILNILADRQAKLTNCYSPLYRKIAKAKSRLKNLMVTSQDEKLEAVKKLTTYNDGLE